MKQIEQIYAFITVDPEDDTEGIAGFLAPNNVMMPLIGADMARIHSLREMAEKISNERGVTLRLCIFKERIELETIEPEDEY